MHVYYSYFRISFIFIALSIAASWGSFFLKGFTLCFFWVWYGRLIRLRSKPAPSTRRCSASSSTTIAFLYTVGLHESFDGTHLDGRISFQFQCHFFVCVSLMSKRYLRLTGNIWRRESIQILAASSSMIRFLYRFNGDWQFSVRPGSGPQCFWVIQCGTWYNNKINKCN